MMRAAMIRIYAICATVLGLSVAASGVAVPETSDLDQVKAANQAYYTALSARDISAMDSVWSRSPNDVNIAPPVRPAAHTGWEAIRKNYETFWATLDELNVSMPDPKINIHGSVAWIYGIEQATRKAKDGQTSGGPNFGTSIFVKERGRWVMVLHQAALIPHPRQ